MACRAREERRLGELAALLAVLVQAGCARDACFQVEGPFTPNLAPEQVEIYDDERGVFCSPGEWVPLPGVHGSHYTVSCRRTWCAEAYHGEDYCVLQSELDAWLANHPECLVRLLDHGEAVPTTLDIDCGGTCETG